MWSFPRQGNVSTMNNSKNFQDFVPLESPTTTTTSMTTLLNNVNRANSDDQQQQRTKQNNSYYNPSRRKNDNRASTYSMNYHYEDLVGKYGGCPWRIPKKQYSKGVLG